MTVAIMTGFLLLRCFLTLLGFADRMEKAETDKDRSLSVLGMVITGLAAVCIIYLATN